MKFEDDGLTPGVTRKRADGSTYVSIPDLSRTPLWGGEPIGRLRLMALVRLGRDELGMTPEECNSNIPHVLLVQAVGEAIVEFHRRRERGDERTLAPPLRDFFQR